MATRTEEIKSTALKILQSNPSGIRYADLVRKIAEELPHIPVNTIHGNVWNLETRLPVEVYKPARGVFRHVVFRDEEVIEEQKPPAEVERIREEVFYRPFADWLVNETEECTKAIPLGRNKFKDKWGTPDVIGKRAPRASDIIKFPIEIVSAELKVDTRDLITAFGQACSYKLFSHKSYLVIPRNSPEADISRLDALCLIFGIGLVLFDSSNPNEPQFDIKVRPLKHDPDMFYVNENMKWIEDELFE
jgi:hypothetical protein